MLGILSDKLLEVVTAAGARRANLRTEWGFGENGEALCQFDLSFVGYTELHVTCTLEPFVLLHPSLTPSTPSHRRESVQCLYRRHPCNLVTLNFIFPLSLLFLSTRCLAERDNRAWRTLFSLI